MADNNFKGTVEALFQGMNTVISSKTVVGDAIHIGDTIIVPFVDISFGVGAGALGGAKAGDKKDQAGGGLGGKMTPSAVLVIQNGQTKLVNIKNQDTVTKILDMVPDFVDKIADTVSGKDGKKVSEEELNDILDADADVTKAGETVGECFDFE